MCNMTPCPENRRLSGWTPWLTANVTQHGSLEKRFRFSCKAPIFDVSLIKIGQAKEEERFCQKDGSCLRMGKYINLLKMFEHFESVF